MRRTLVWIVAVPLVAAIGISISIVARHAGTATQDPASDNVAISKCPATTPDACVLAMGQLYDVSAGPLPSFSVPRRLTYVGGELLNYKTERHAIGILSFRTQDGRTYEVEITLIDATHGFPAVDTRPTETTPEGRDYKENRGSLGIIAISFVDRRFIYVVHRPFMALLDRPSGSLGEAETLVDATHAVR